MSSSVGVLAFVRWEGERREMRALRRGKVRLGGRGGFTLPPGSLNEGFALLWMRRGGAELRLAAGLEGVARIGGQRRDLGAEAGEGQAPRKILLRPGDCGIVRDPAWNGAMVEFVCAERQEERFARRFRADVAMAGGLAVAAGLHAAALGLVLAVGPAPVKAQKARRLMQAVSELREPEEKKKEKERPPDPESDEADRRADARAARGGAVRRARAQGVLAALKQLDRRAPSGGLGALFSPQNDVAAAVDAVPSLGSLASALGDGVGPGVGEGGSTGGAGMGTVGAALLKGSGGPSLGQRRARAVGGTVGKVPPRQVRVGGGLDRAEVLKVVNQHMSAVRNCYERALLARPDLEGKLTLEWTVGGGGAVISVRLASSTMRDQTVANCIMGDIRRWMFPKPIGGRAVTVVFPFIFNASGY